MSRTLKDFLGSAGNLWLLVSLLWVGVQFREERWFRGVRPAGFLLVAGGSWLLTWTNEGNQRYFYLLCALVASAAFLTRLVLWIQDKRMLVTSQRLETGDIWVLGLQRRVPGGSVECIVTDPMGGRSRQVFAGGGRPREDGGDYVEARYPDEFSGYNTYVHSKKPWGEYKVTWQTYQLKGKRLRRGRRARDAFRFDLVA